MSTINQEIRKHLRKGELAVALLESLGYTYIPQAHGPAKWEAPEDVLDPVIESIKRIIKDNVDNARAELEDAHKRSTKLEPGDTFCVDHMPAGHMLGRNISDWRNRVFKAREVLLDPERGWVVRFNIYGEIRGYWLPLANVTKVRSHADF